jgi:hypothetical protein
MPIGPQRVSLSCSVPAQINATPRLPSHDAHGGVFLLCPFQSHARAVQPRGRDCGRFYGTP